MSDDCQGKGVGTKLYQALFDELETQSIRSVMAVIALPNPASIGLHEKMGFEKVAHFKEVGYKHETWINVGYWQKMFD
jgi:phosphinothricin acetyltransferase